MAIDRKRLEEVSPYRNDLVNIMAIALRAEFFKTAFEAWPEHLKLSEKEKEIYSIAVLNECFLGFMVETLPQFNAAYRKIFISEIKNSLDKIPLEENQIH